MTMDQIEEYEYWPEGGYGQHDIASINAVTILSDKAMLSMTVIDGCQVCMVVPLGDLIGAVRQIIAHVAPAEILSKNLVVINGGKAVA